MLVVRSQCLDEGYEGQPLLLQILKEVVFVLQVRRRYRVPGAILERSVVVIVSEGLVVPLELLICRVAPAFGG